MCNSGLNLRSFGDIFKTQSSDGIRDDANKFVGNT